jgi:hypothetical protein
MLAQSPRGNLWDDGVRRVLAGILVEGYMGMIDKADHIPWAAEAVAVFQERCGTSDKHAIADLRDTWPRSAALTSSVR